MSISGRHVEEKEKSKHQLSEQINAELEKAIDELTLFDDDLMSKVFDENIEATELILQIILERKDIKVVKVKGQVELKSPYPQGRNIKLDIHAVDGNGSSFDVEVQRNAKGAHNRRPRFHQSMMDARILKKNQDFKELNDIYVIFICQHDKFKENKPIYHVDKIIRETGKSYDDGSHIIFVNGKYRGEDDFGRLAHDFNCKRADNIFFKPLADGVRHFKETEEGRDAMCESFTKLADKVADEREMQTRAMDVSLLMDSMKMSLEQALDALKIQGKERAIIAKQLQK